MSFPWNILYDIKINIEFTNSLIWNIFWKKRCYKILKGTSTKKPLK